MTESNRALTLTLKLGERFIKIPLDYEDNQESLYRKFMEADPYCSKTQSEVIQKIKRQLNSLTRKDDIDPSLRQRVKILYSKIFREGAYVQEWPLSEIAVNSRIKSCCSQLILLPIKTPNHKCTQTEQNQSKTDKIQFMRFKQEKSSRKKQNKSLSPKKEIRSQKQRSTVEDKHSNAENIVIKKTKKEIPKKKKRVNPDLIKACEIIMKKTKHNDMKLLAKDFLRENGYLKEEKAQQMKEKRKNVCLTEQIQANHKKRYTVFSTSSPKNIESTMSHINPSINCQHTHSKNHTSTKYKYLQSISMSVLPSLNLNKDYDRQNEKKGEHCAGKTPKKYSYI